MTYVAVYCEQPILTAGLRNVTANLEDLKLSATFTDFDPLMEHVRTSRPSLVLLEATPAVTFARLSNLHSIAVTRIVLWVDAAATEFVSQALVLGVRGILRKSLPEELLIKCLRNVAAGDLWVEQGLCDQLLTSKRATLTRRERQVVGLLAQGLKNKEIAHAMRLSEGTVKVYLSRLFQKVGVSGRFELTLFAIKNGFVGAARGPEQARIEGESRRESRSSPAFSIPGFVSGARSEAVVQ